jgi:guanylate kinase
MMISKKAVILSAPSGSGKTTLVSYLLKKIPMLQFSVSATSRNPRKNETHRKDYYFLSRTEFEKKIENGEFVEWEEVYHGVYYGTLKSEIENIWGRGKSVIFDVDVKGGINLKNYFGDSALSIYILLQNREELERRLRNRHTESEKSIGERLAKAENEIRFKNKFDRIVLNDDLNKAQQEIYEMVNDFLKNQKH